MLFCYVILKNALTITESLQSKNCLTRIISVQSARNWTDITKEQKTGLQAVRTQSLPYSPIVQLIEM